MRIAVFFNLTQIQMPVGAITSITHRISGILLAIRIPFGVYLLDRSLQGPLSYAWVSALFGHKMLKLVALACPRTSELHPLPSCQPMHKWAPRFGARRSVRGRTHAVHTSGFDVMPLLRLLVMWLTMQVLRNAATAMTGRGNMRQVLRRAPSAHSIANRTGSLE